MDNYDLEEGDRTVNYIQVLYLYLLLEKYLGPNPYLLVDKERLILSTGITETGHQSFRTHLGRFVPIQLSRLVPILIKLSMLK